MLSYIGLMSTFWFIYNVAASAVTGSSLSGFNWVGGKRNVYSDHLTWMMMEDGRGNPQLAILKGAESTHVKIDLSKDVHFILYTKSNIHEGHRLYLGDSDGLEQSPFNRDNPTKILIHGWHDDLNAPVIQTVKDAYLSHVDSYNVNVIAVDWEVLAKPLMYNLAKAKVIPVGNFVADMIDFLNSAGGSANSRTHLIGHSLGAHVAGVAGTRVNGTVARVTGLDPAFPLFGDDPDSGRLDPSDAAFVDVIHTCGGWVGFMGTRGHADFYPNGGVSIQPGCGTSDITGGCSHGKAVKLFVASIMNQSEYPAHKCSTIDNAEHGKCDAATSGYMGDGASTTMRGVYWMATQ